MPIASGNLRPAINSLAKCPGDVWPSSGPGGKCPGDVRRRAVQVAVSDYCLCLPSVVLVMPLALIHTISGLVAALVPVSFSGPGAALGSMPYLILSPVMVMRLYLCASLFQVRPSSLLLSLVLVRPLCLLQSAVMMWPQDLSLIHI